jgi:hypothetical protein
MHPYWHSRRLRNLYPSLHVKHPFGSNLIAGWNFQRWRRSQYRQHPSPGQGRPGMQWEKLLWMQRKWQQTGNKKD